jgi:hypothetical protein
MLTKILYFYDLPAEDPEFQEIITKFDQDVDGKYKRKKENN